MNLLRSNRGLTIIELLLTLSMISFIIIAIYSFYITGLRGWQRGTDHMEAQQSARIAMDKIISELRFAHQVSLHDQNREVRFQVSGDSRTRRFRLVNNELVFDSYPTSHPSYFHTKVALGIDELHFHIAESKLLTVSLNAACNNSRTRLTSAVLPKNVEAGEQ